MAVAGTLTTITLPARLVMLPFVVDWVLARTGKNVNDETVRRAT